MCDFFHAYPLIGTALFGAVALNYVVFMLPVRYPILHSIASGQARLQRRL
jgi:hypothetical protein